MAGTPQAKKRVLIIDDDDDTVESLVALLEDSYDVTTASNGQDGFCLLRHQPFDAALLDLTMPAMDGETLLAEMKAVGLAVPVVLASGVYDLQSIARRLGVACIAKPYDISTLRTTLARVIAPCE